MTTRPDIRPGLSRELGLLGLAATGICSMLGAAINVIPFMILRSVPAIGPFVLPAYAFAAIPAALAALAYAILASAMPRAGGSYVFASRALHPYLGFVASFSQWFGLSIAMGVVAYVLIPFLRDMAVALSWMSVARALDTGVVRTTLALAILWAFVAVNLGGIKSYERTLIPLMILMFVLGAVVIVAGFHFNHADFTAAVLRREGRTLPPAPPAPPLGPSAFLAASVLLFSSFIGFDAIAQAGGEAKRPSRTLPLAIGIALLSVGSFYLLFTGAVYHTVPWSYVAEQAMTRDVTAPGLLGYLLPPAWTLAIVGGAAVALTNDLPAMLLAVSRLMFAWAEDGVFPKAMAHVHPRRRTPDVAIVASGLTASAGILGSHYAGDFFLGVDILVLSMLVNFLLMCLAVIALPAHNPSLARHVRVLPRRAVQVPLMLAGAIALAALLGVHVWKDLGATGPWYLHSTPVWIGVMAAGSVVYVREVRKLKRAGVNVTALFSTLPPE